MLLYKANSQAVLEAMFRAGIDGSQELCSKAPVNKSTMTKVINHGLVKGEMLERIAAVLHVNWESLQNGHVFVQVGPKRGEQKTGDDLRSEVVDVLAAFGHLAAYRTGQDSAGVRCLAYLCDKGESHLNLGW
ncbi:MAG: hypothetical protein ACYC3X_27755 [Pirellulaceae bacterium]